MSQFEDVVTVTAAVAFNTPLSAPWLARLRRPSPSHQLGSATRINRGPS